MAITRTGLGTASSKTSGTTINLSSKTVHAGCSLLVGVGYVTGQGSPVVKWGQRELDQLVTRSQAGMGVAWFILRHIKNTVSRDIVATWQASILGRAMIALEINGANVLDASQGNTQTATTDPVTGTAVETTQDDTIAVALFGSRGPSTDTVGTVGVGHTSGQRMGTTGAPPISNVTIHETWENLPTSGSNVRATKTGATERDWANVIVNLKYKRSAISYGLCPSNFRAVADKFEAVDKDGRKAVYWFNPETTRFEIFEVDEGSLGTMVTHSENGFT